MSAARRPGALVLSLDFELHWGVRDHRTPDGPYRANLLGARDVVPAMLERFAAAGAGCTWATVGMLLARGRTERDDLSPTKRPRYRDVRLDAYQEPVGEDERTDPLHYAPSLVQRILATPRQELATHTWSHYYCLEPGQEGESFEADLRAAVAAARSWGASTRSIVFPRNQHNPAYDGILRRNGIRSFRGDPSGWMNRGVAKTDLHLAMRGARWFDLHAGASAPRTYAWDELPVSEGLVDVPASFFLRPMGSSRGVLGRARLARVLRAVRYAAQQGRLVHLWWHPHNFGRDQATNLAYLDEILELFTRCREREGMLGLGMDDVAGMVLEARDG